MTNFEKLEQAKKMLINELETELKKFIHCSTDTDLFINESMAYESLKKRGIIADWDVTENKQFLITPLPSIQSLMI